MAIATMINHITSGREEELIEHFAMLCKISRWAESA
jgi:hypothetical protein